MAGDLVERARRFATQAHARIDQRRKYTRQPYDVHLKRVAELVASVDGGTAMLAAAWLHDTVEDTPATLEDIEAEFGAEVAALVGELTDVSRPGDGNRAARKAIDRAHLAAASAAAKTVKLADLIDNCRDICAHDAGFAPIYAAEMEALLLVLGEGDPRLLRKARAEVQRCRARMDGRDASVEDAPEDLSAYELGLRADHARSLRLFAGTFAASDVAEPLPSFDAERPAKEVLGVMAERGLTVAGVRQEGVVRGYVRRQELAEGPLGLHSRPLRPDQVLSGSTPLSDVVHCLTRHEQCFVAALGEVAGVVSRHDMEKPAGRMWLFGIITFTEVQLTDRIRARWPGGTWTGLLSPSRLERARALMAQRHDRGQSCDLLDCLQLSDKGQVLMAAPEEREAFGFSTKGAAARVLREFESLRNHLAHGQGFVDQDWAQIARLAGRIASMAGPD